jgi:phosphate-selective porin
LRKVLKNQEQAEIRFEKELIGQFTEDFKSFSGLSRNKELESKYLSADEVRPKYVS